jgi:hypothetical protein
MVQRSEFLAKLGYYRALFVSLNKKSAPCTSILQIARNPSPSPPNDLKGDRELAAQN